MSSPPVARSGRRLTLHPLPSQSSLPASPSSLSPPISAPSSPSLLPSQFPASPPPLGHLHLTPSTFTDYLNIPYRRGDFYELIDGILYHRRDEMADPHHRSIQSVLVAMFAVANVERPDDEWVTATADARVGIRGSSRNTSGASGSSRRGREDSCLIADIAVGAHVSAEDEATMSPTSMKVDFPPGRPPPSLVVEVTSSNRTKDLTTNVGEYARAGVPEYVIVDREKSKVIVYKLKEDDKDKRGTKATRSSRISSAGEGNGIRTYRSVRYYSGDETLEAVALRDLKLTANNLLHPSKSSTRVILSPLHKKNAENRKQATEIRKLTKGRDEDAAENRKQATEIRKLTKGRDEDAAEIRKQTAEVRKLTKKRDENTAEIRKITKERDEARAFLDRLKNEKMQNKRGRNDRSPDKTGASGSKDKNNSPSNSPDVKKGRSGQGSTKGRGGSGK